MSDEKKPDEKKPSSELAVRVNTVRGWLEAQKPELARVLGKDGNVERFARIALTCALRKPEIGACSRQSFALAVMEAAQLGLELDSVSGMAYLVPFKGVVTLIPGYRGLIQLAYRHPKVVEITPHLVYEGDEYDYREGLRPNVLHRPVRRDTMPKPEEIVAGYVRATTRGGGHPFIWMWKAEMDALHRDRSRAYRSGEGPWITDTHAMYLRCPVKTLTKFLPQSVQLVQALAIEDDPEFETPPGAPPIPYGTTVEQALDAIAESGA